MNNISIEDFLKSEYPELLIEFPSTQKQLSNKQLYVYCLLLNEKPIIIGRGKKKRAKVIFDELTNITISHIKSFHLRLYFISSKHKETYKRLIIHSNDPTEAKNIETILHKKFGGNTGYPETSFFELLELSNINKKNSALFLKLAYYSSYSGLNDLRKWRRENLISKDIWDEIVVFFKLVSLENKKGWYIDPIYVANNHLALVPALNN